MFNRLFVFCTLLIISQYVVFTFNSYSQTAAITPDQEFEILSKEVQAGFISFGVPDSARGKTLAEITATFSSIIGDVTGNARRIIYGEELVPKNVLDITDFSLEWWTHASIYGIINRNKAQGEKYLCQLIYIGDPKSPKHLLPPPLDLFEPVSRDSRDDINPIPMPDPSPPDLPNLTWQYPLEQIPVRPPDDFLEGLFELSAWRPTKNPNKNWKRNMVIALASGGIAYFLNWLSQPEIEIKEDFVYHPSEGPNPIFWTASALGEPTWKRPSIPPGITLAEWRQRTDLQMWYPNPPHAVLKIEKEPTQAWYMRRGRELSFIVSVSFASRVTYGFVRAQFFPIKNFP